MATRTLILAAALLLTAPSAVDAARTGYLFHLSSFAGTVPLDGGRLMVDPYADNEVYVVASNEIRIFNDSGMETYRFGNDASLGFVTDVAATPDGDLVLLSNDRRANAEATVRLTRCDYRGNPKAGFRVSGLPAELQPFRPDRLFWRSDRFYLVSRDDLRVAVVRADGSFERSYDLAKLLEIPDEKRSAVDVGGFDVDPGGNLLLTITSRFLAYVISPDGKVRSFGDPGSTPGSFAVLSDIASDGKGHYYVSDRGRSVVMVFDTRFELITEFGYPGPDPKNLLRPGDIAVAGDGRVYVTQMGNRGIAAFSVGF